MTKREWQLAIPILVGIALCLAGFVHGQRLEDAVDGMSALRTFSTAQGERVAVIANNALHVLDAAGHRLARQDIKTLGLTESPNDMDWTVDEQQLIEAWFFDDTVPRVLRCTWSTEQVRLTNCRNAMAGAQLKANARSVAVHLAVDSVGQRVFIADAKSHRVQVFDLAGKALMRTDPKAVPLSFPNRLRYLGKDTLVVADNDHRRLAWLKVTPGQPPQLLCTLNSADHGQARSGRGKVTDAALGPTGTIWMLAVKQGQKDGDVLVFDAKQQPVARAALPDGADPLIIDTLDNAALVADYSLVSLYRIDAQGRNLGEFGDVAFRGEIGPLGAQRQQGALWKTGALVCGGVIMVAGLLLGWLYGEKPKKPGQFDSQTIAALASLGKGDSGLRFPVVLRQPEAYRSSVRKNMAVTALVAMAMIAISGVPLLSLDYSGKLLSGWTIPAVAITGGVLATVIAWLAWREVLRPTELKVTEQRLGLFKDGQQICAAPLKDVYASTNALLLGSRTIRFRTAVMKTNVGPTMFDMDQLNRAVLSRLPPQNLVTDQALAWIAFKRSALAFKVIMFILFAAAMLMSFYPLFQ